MIIQTDSEGNVVGKYESVSQASEETELYLTNIAACVRGTRKTCGGFTWSEVEDEEPEKQDFVPNAASTAWEQDGKNAKFSGAVAGENLTTLEQVLARCNVDLSVWDVKNHEIKHWQTSMKKKILVDPGTGLRWKEGVPATKGFVTTHEEIQLLNTGWTVNFVQKSYVKETLVALLKTHIGALPPSAKRPAVKSGKYAAEFMITDHHLGKIGFDSVTMKFNWSIEEAMAEYDRVIDFGLSKLPLDHINEFWLPTGNDFYNVDNNLGTTTSGTKIGNEQFWLNTFRYGKEAVIKAITRLKQYGKVKVPFIDGNHDSVTVLALSEVIKEVFRGDPDVEIVCSGRGRDFLPYGRNLIGWHHGQSCNPDKAQAAMFSDVPHLLSDATRRYMHVGHEHRSTKKEVLHLNTLEERAGLVYEVCPALTPTDHYHDRNLFIGNLRRSKIFVYDYEGGIEGEYTYNLRSR